MSQYEFLMAAKRHHDMIYYIENLQHKLSNKRNKIKDLKLKVTDLENKLKVVAEIKDILL